MPLRRAIYLDAGGPEFKKEGPDDALSVSLSVVSM